MADERGLVPAEEVARSFVHMYFKFLGTSSDELCKFYDKDNSRCTRADGSLEGKVAKGRDQIKELLSEWPYSQNAKTNMDPGSVDCQYSAEGNILVLVTGTIVTPESPMRAFVQSFYLAKQGNKRSAYFVLNDSMRLLDTTVARDGAGGALAAPLPPVDDASSKAAAEAAAEAERSAEAAKAAKAAAREAAAKEAAAAEQARAAAAEAASAAGPEEPIPEEEPAAAVPAAAVPAVRPSSYAAAAKAKAAPPAPPKARPAPAARPASGAGTAAVEDTRFSSGANRGLFVRCSSESTEDEVRAVLGTYGEVASVTMTSVSRGFIYAEMANATNAQAAIKASRDAHEAGDDTAITCHGERMTIEAKQTRTGGDRGRSRGRGARDGSRTGGRGRGDRGDTRNTRERPAGRDRDSNSRGRGRGRGGRGGGRGRGERSPTGGL